MSLFEVQMKVDAFLAGQRAQLRLAKFCPPPPFAMGPFLVQVQRLDFGANHIRHNVREDFLVQYRDPQRNHEPPYFAQTRHPASGFSTQIGQQVLLHFTSQTAIMSSPNAEPAPLIPPIEFTVVCPDGRLRAAQPLRSRGMDDAARGAGRGGGLA